METLKEIMRVVTLKADIKRVFPELLDAESAQSVTTTYVKGIIDNQYRDDDEAASQLYGGNRTDQRYRTLKSRVYDRLLVALLNLQVKQPEHSLYLSMYYKCSRNSVAAQTLMRFASRKAGATLAERTLQIADKFHFTDLQISLLYSLRTTVVFQRNVRQYMHYNARLQHLLRVQEAELSSEYYIDIALLDVPDRSRTTHKTMSISETINHLKTLRDEYKTNTLYLNYFRIRMLHAENTLSFSNIIDIADEALEYFETYTHFKQPARLGEFTLLKAIASSCLRRFESAIEACNLCIASFAQGGSNWYLSLDIAFVAAMNAGQYERAASYYVQATENKRYTLQPDITLERWKTYEAYIHLVHELRLHDYSEVIRRSNFRVTSYINSVPEFSKDKKYSNFLIIVSHICLLISRRELDNADRRIEYLRTYTHRYLKEAQFARAKLFSKALTVLSKDFDISAETRNDIDVIKTELSKHLDEPMTNEVNEVISYEVLLDAILAFLSTVRISS